ncbi:MAG: protein BatD [Acidobacteria bacterium]|nr:protein BatD [Acidobacteriota bacterium]
MMLISVFLGGGISFVRADENRITAAVDARRIGENDRVTLQITVEGPDTGDAQPIGEIASGDFRLISGPHVSTQFQLINGRASSSKTFSYVFFPLKKGNLKLPPVQIKVGDTVHTTTPVEVDVVSGTVRPQTPGRRDPFESLFNDRRERPDEPEREIGNDVFVRLELDRERLFTGESTEADLMLYYRASLPVVGTELEQEGKFRGIGHESIDLSKLGRNLVETRTVGDEPYYAQPLARWVLLPSRPGEFTLEPWILRIAIRVPARSFFSFGRQQVILRRTDPVKLTVLDFPAAGRPEDFSGLCGQFQLKAGLDKQAAKVGEAVTYSLTLAGRGNLRGLAEPEMPQIDECKVYSPTVNDSIRLDDGHYRGSRTWEYVLVPLQSGQITVPERSLAVFDPRAGTYRRLTTDRLTIQVSPGDSETTDHSPSRPTALPLSLKGRDIRFIRTTPELVLHNERRIYESAWYIGAAGSVLILSLGILFFQERRQRLRQDERAWACSRAGIRARRMLRRAVGNARKGASGEFFQQLGELWGAYLEDRFGVRRIEMTGTRLRQHLTEKGVAEETTEALMKILTLCESHRYAPEQPEAVDPAALVERCRQLLQKLEETA